MQRGNNWQRSPRRALSGGLLGLGISVLKILGFDRVNTCPWADGFEHSVNTASDYHKQILRPRGMGVKCFLAPEFHLRGIKRIISRVFSQLREVQTFPTAHRQSWALIKSLCLGLGERTNLAELKRNLKSSVLCPPCPLGLWISFYKWLERGINHS